MNKIVNLQKYLNNKDIFYIELGKLFNIKNGYTPSKANLKFWTNGTIPWFRMEDIRKNGRILEKASQHVTIESIKGDLFKKNSILISTSATIGEHAILNVDGLANQTFTCLEIKDEYKLIVDPKYIYYCCFILGEWCKKNVNKSSLESVDKKAFLKYKFSIPSLEIQKNIIKKLESLDFLNNELINNINKEKKLRKTQLKYYKNLLLDFNNNENMGGGGSL